MGDVLALVEQVEQQVDKDKAAKLAEKVAKGKKFDLNDLRDQLEQMKNMGGIGGLMDKLPGLGSIPDHLKQQVSQGGSAAHDRHHQLDDQKERRNPNLLNGSRRARIAKARA
jgi:signal recognition particle subunit SRP54